MERVQFQQERMLPELRDLVEKNIFTEKEIKYVVKKRTVFETALVRRIAKKSDFLRYASYEMGLEQLRRKRIDRLDLPPSPATISDYAFVRRQFSVFERALKRFKSDVGLWIQYIQIAKREGARALVGRITARALQLHPNMPAFYILAASHELDNLSPSAARALLQRGIRINPENVDMWKEYVKMELGFIESLRRRWDVLGIKVTDSNGKGKQKATVEDPSQYLTEENATNDKLTQHEVEDDCEGLEGAEARQQIMEGAIVKSVILNAAQALPKIELFETLKALILEYPSPTALRQSLSDYLYDVLHQTLPQDPMAMELRATRFLGKDTKTVDFVEGLRLANEEMLSTLKENSQEALFDVYAGFVANWCEKPLDGHLKTYLISSLHALIERTETSQSSLLATHIKVLMEVFPISPAKLRRTGQKYTSKVPTSSRVWLARLVAEKELIKYDDGSEGGSAVAKLWAEARMKAHGTQGELIGLWTWGIDNGEDAEVRKRIHEQLLRESLRDTSLQGVHEALLLSYVTVLGEVFSRPDSGVTSDQRTYWSKWLHSIRHMASVYLTTGKVWQELFQVVVVQRGEISGKETDGKERTLEEVYKHWCQKDGIEATFRWAKWMLGHGKGREARDVVVRAKHWFLEETSAELESRWMAVLDEVGMGLC